jgi:hypothetical protein
LDLTFASRVSGRVGSECQIRSTSGMIRKNGHDGLTRGVLAADAFAWNGT